jgi:hypothetical protein
MYCTGINIEVRCENLLESNHLEDQNRDEKTLSCISGKIGCEGGRWMKPVQDYVNVIFLKHAL